jgi:hypothetical protein
VGVALSVLLGYLACVALIYATRWYDREDREARRWREEQELRRAARDYWSRGLHEKNGPERAKKIMMIAAAGMVFPLLYLLWRKRKPQP